MRRADGQIWAVGLVAVVFAAGCASSSSTTAQVAGGSAPSSQPGSSQPPAVPKPAGKVSGSCDMLLNSNFTSSVTGWLVADVEIRNSGNVGYVANAKAVWKQAGSAPIVKVKPVTVPYGRSKAVHFKLPIDQNQVSAFQAAPGYESGNTPCSFTATIMRTVGPAH